jgi:hypothetical protein
MNPYLHCSEDLAMYTVHIFFFLQRKILKLFLYNITWMEHAEPQLWAVVSTVIATSGSKNVLLIYLESRKILWRSNTQHMLLNSSSYETAYLKLRGLWRYRIADDSCIQHKQESSNYRVLQKELYNFESLYESIQRTCAVLGTVIV